MTWHLSTCIYQVFTQSYWIHTWARLTTIIVLVERTRDIISRLFLSMMINYHDIWNSWCPCKLQKSTDHSYLSIDRGKQDCGRQDLLRSCHPNGKMPAGKILEDKILASYLKLVIHVKRGYFFNDILLLYVTLWIGKRDLDEEHIDTLMLNLTIFLSFGYCSPSYPLVDLSNGGSPIGYH